MDILDQAKIVSALKCHKTRRNNAVKDGMRKKLSIDAIRELQDEIQTTKEKLYEN